MMINKFCVNDKCYIVIELMFLKELILTKEAHQESDICRYWNFLGKEFKFVSQVCNECYVLMTSINLSNIYMLKVNGTHYHFIINRISKSDAVNLLESAGLIEESGVLKNKKNIKNLLPYIKWVKKL